MVQVVGAEGESGRADIVGLECDLCFTIIRLCDILETCDGCDNAVCRRCAREFKDNHDIEYIANIDGVAVCMECGKK